MGFTLIIAEKPQASKKIAEALANSKPKTIETEDGVKYYEFVRNGKKHVVVPAVGHLFSLKDANKGWNYPVFNYVWKPTYQINKKAFFAKKYFENIQRIAKEADNYIIATDFDIEGSVIGFNILRFLCGLEDGFRMKFSTLTKEDIVAAYENPMKHLDFNFIEAGLTRHELDWLWGINTTRALTLSLKKGGKKLSYYLLSAGRVQAPMLYLLYQKEKEIRAFKPEPFWQIEAKIQLTKNLLVSAFHETDKFWKKEDAEKIFKKCKNVEATVIDIETKKYKQSPPIPFDLTTLQTEAYRYFGWSPVQTINVAQSLYESAFISYPRTSSQKLPQQIGLKNILQQLSKLKNYSSLAKKILSKEIVPNEGKKEDPAHPAIHPTSEVPDLSKLNAQQKKLYDLIVRRFLAVFGEPAIRESMKITFDINGERFPVTGRRTIEKGWMEYYGNYAKVDETLFPDIRKGDKFYVSELILLDKETTPPPRYSQGSIVKELEKRNIGTKTTRAQILQTLYERGYIFGKSIEVTDLGMRISEILTKYVPDIVSEDLTRKFEKEMEAVEKNKKKRETVVKNAKKVLTKIIKEFKLHEEKIGAEMEKAILETKQQQSIIGPCPNCGGELKRLFAPVTRKYFVGCSNYPKCKTGYPLPHNSRIQRLDKICEQCKTPMIQVMRQGRRPFRMCLSPQCPTKADWGKNKEKLNNKK